MVADSKILSLKDRFLALVRCLSLPQVTLYIMIEISSHSELIFFKILLFVTSFFYKENFDKKISLKNPKTIRKC